MNAVSSHSSHAQPPLPPLAHAPCRGAALEALEDKRAALKDYRDALALNPGLGDAAAAVRRLETALGEPSSLPPAGGGSKRERGGARGGGDAVSEEDVRQLEETKQRVREVALQKARAREQQTGAQKERRQLELTLGQVEGLKEDVRRERPRGRRRGSGRQAGRPRGRVRQAQAGGQLPSISPIQGCALPGATGGRRSNQGYENSD
jgi:hypothetical protein